MKIHRIEVDNLNALYGHHEVDLDAELGQAPLFVIVGPTGAGKSTLLDAVSLALFGETPRLDNRRARDRGDDDDSRHVMSRGTGECRSVLTFSRLDARGQRQRYRATWYCHRANREPDGAFQTPKRALERYDAAREAWDLLVEDHRKKFFAAPFDEALDGLTVKDFQRSLLLPQGQLTALLRADPEQKAAILERLTSTADYAEIGQRCNQTRLEATRKVDLLEARLDGVALATAEEMAELERSVGAARGRVDGARASLLRLQAEHAWLASDDALTDAHGACLAARDDALAARDLAAADLARLDAHERLDDAAAALDAWRGARDEAADNAAAQRELAAHLDALRERAEALAAALTADREAHGAARAALEEATPRIAVARRALDAARTAAATARDETARAEALGRDRADADAAVAA